MSSVTTWQRLEGLPRSDDLRTSLRAEIADPLWLLARQRQFAELWGEDAGSPVNAMFEATAAPLARLHLGLHGPGAAARSVDLDAGSPPLETMVERERLFGTGADGGLVVSAGLHFLRLLRRHAASRAVGAYVEHYGLTAADLPGDDVDARTLRRRAVGRVPDARLLAADLLAHRGDAATLGSLPAAPDVSPADPAKVLEAANRFLAAWAEMLSEPEEGDPSAWNPQRLEHSFAIQADLGQGPVVLRSDEYRGRRLDWHDFVVGGRPDLGPPTVEPPVRAITRSMLPTPVTYGGMPADRFWEIEDGTVRFGGLETERTDLARMLLAEFALTYGNDWFVVPVDLPVGTITAIESFTVVDSFGVETMIGPSASPDPGSFRMFDIDASAGPQRAANLLFLAPAVAEINESPPVEHVVFVRDEMANLVWGIERLYQGSAGGPIERFEEYQRRLGERQEIDTDIGDAQVIYRLQSDIPDHWHPFVPVRAAGVAPTAGVIQLERRPLTRVLADGTSLTIEPKGRILTARSPLRLEEEEVPRQGTEVVRTFQLVRWSDGRYHLWSGFTRWEGPGEGRSNYRTDFVVPALG